jgi:hypothetical protein
MADQTDFLNDALGQIGATRITAIDDGSLNADYCGMFWPPMRRSLIRSHHWNFATDQAQLALNTGAPLFEFAFSYALPTDLLKVTTFNGEGVYSLVAPSFDGVNLQLYPYSGRYKILGRNLLSNDTPVFIEYLKDVENPDLWDMMFYQAAAAMLASKLALAIAKNAAMSRELMQQATVILMPLAMAVDGQEGTELPYIVNDLLRVR